VFGENILSAQAGFDYSKRYSEYQYKGQVPGNDLDFGETVSGVFASVTDSMIKRKRIKIIHGNEPLDTGAARDLLRWSAMYEAGKSQMITYTVAGWRGADGQLWQPNQTVEVRDRFLGIKKEMLISEVGLSMDDNGLVTRLVVAPIQAYQLPASNSEMKLNEWDELTHIV